VYFVYTILIIIIIICLCQLLGRWYTVATRSNSVVERDSEVAQLTSSDTDGVINVLFTAAM